jgi:hypothetical protein
MSKEALKLWIGLPADTRQMLLNNVWCGECQKAVTIVARVWHFLGEK